ncbi:MAG: response regulator [Gemmatimonadota bacterium]|nr:response regulator [Gemmatimonadota bacterium]
MRLLLIDDDPEIRHVATIALETMGGHEVECAATAEEGVERASARAPDGVLLDVVLPDADGVELLDRLRGIEGMEEVPIVFLTGKASTETARLERADARGAITKPFDPLALADEVDRLLGSSTGSPR